MLKTLLRGCKQYRIVRKNQTVDTAASNSDTPLDSVVIVYPTQKDYEEEC